MLKTYGQIYSSTPAEFEAVTNVLKAGGFEIAYINNMNGYVLKEVQSLDEGEVKEET